MNTKRVVTVGEAVDVIPSERREEEQVPAQALGKVYLRISDYITEETYESIASNLITLISSHNTSDIVLYIDSPGGGFEPAYNIVKLLNSMPNKVITVAYRDCSSAACMIFAAGVERYMLKGTRYVLHQLKGLINTHDHGLQISEIRDIERTMKKEQEIYRDSIMAGSELPLNVINEILKNPKDTILSEGKIAKYKIATKIFKKWNEIDI